jgi:Rab GDP dissociation inhibitor
VYICCLGATHNVAPAGKYVAIVSTTVETGTPQKELDAALKVLGPIDETFITVADTFEPLADGSADKVYISKSYDATSHFETTMIDVLDMWQRITGAPLDLNKKPDAVIAMEAQQQ